jgi:hypothetical protein
VAAVAAAVTILALWIAPAGPDLAAHEFQRAFFQLHGYTAWNNLWYAGQYDFVTYSLIYYPLAALFGLNALAVASVTMAAVGFGLLVTDRWGRVARLSALGFALVWPGLVLTGALPFALGMAFVLGALAALQCGAKRTFGVLALLGLAASPLSFLFLLLALVGPVVAARRPWRLDAGYRGPALVVGGALLVELVLWRAFPATGRYPFWGEDFAGACATAVIGTACCWRVAALKPLRYAFLVYGAACIALFFIPTELGANIARLRLLAVPLTLLVLAVRRWRPIPLSLAILIASVWWNGTAITTAYARSSLDTSSQPSYWTPTVGWLKTHLTPDYRVEAVDTSGHWPAMYLPGAGIPIARGWFRQADFPANEVLYHPLTSDLYLRWLRQLSVRYVVLSDAPSDFSATNEAGLIRSGRSGLTLAARLGEVSIYSVPDPQPLVVGPGAARVRKVTSSGLVIDIAAPGTYRLAVRWSPYWRTSLGCTLASADGMTELVTPTAGTADFDLTVSAEAALRVVTGQVARPCPTPASG